MIPKNPTDWIRDCVIYHILIDRFAGVEKGKIDRWDKPEFLGGNIKAIITKLPYLDRLGINAIYLSPFYQGVDYHGYHVQDPMKVDPRFGSLEDILKLIETSHKLGIKIIADFVPNHLHDSSEYFKKAREDRTSEYRDWFYFDEYNEYKKYFHLGFLPKVNLEKQPAREFMIKTALYWFKNGIDALRIDHAVGIPHDFYKEFRDQIKAQFPSAVLLGEAIIKAQDIRNNYHEIFVKKKFLRSFFNRMSIEALQQEYCGVIDGVLDFVARGHFLDFAGGKINKKQLERHLHAHFKRFPKDFILPIFADNHDNNRILYECNNNKDKMQDLFTIMFKFSRIYRQPIIIYYGTEVGMSQLGPLRYRDYSDLMARRCMIWNSQYQDRELLDFFHSSIKSRIKNG